jgi:shikimate kinase
MRTPSGSNADPKTPARQSASTVRAIFLVGFMGAGKTSVGKVLGRRLGWLFEDLDDRVHSREGRTVEQIFRESGEAGFRRAETSALRELLEELAPSHRVVALGGGAFVQAENAALLDRADVASVFLDGPAEELFRRCHKQQMERPLRGTLDQFQKLYQQRRPLYMKATVRIDTTGKDVETVAREISHRVGVPQKNSGVGREP